MIVNLILILINFVLEPLTLALPSATLPTWITGKYDSIIYNIQTWNFILPMSSIVLLIAFFVLVEGTILTVYGVNAIIKIVRGSG